MIYSHQKRLRRNTRQLALLKIPSPNTTEVDIHISPLKLQASIPSRHLFGVATLVSRRANAASPSSLLLRDILRNSNYCECGVPLDFRRCAN